MRHDHRCRTEDTLPFESIYELQPTPSHAQPVWVGWQGLTAWERSAFKPPCFMLGDCPAAISAFYHDHVDVADTGVFRLRDCGVTGAGMAVRGDVLLASNHLGHSLAYCHEQIASGRLGALSGYASRKVSRAVLLLGAGYDVYGHCWSTLSRSFMRCTGSGSTPPASFI